VAGAALSIGVGALELSAALSRDAAVAELWVEVDLPGDDLATSEQLTTKRIDARKPMAGGLDLGYSLSVPVAAGSVAFEALREALASSQEEDADVRTKD